MWRNDLLLKIRCSNLDTLCGTSSRFDVQYLHRLDVSLTRNAEGKTGRIFVGDMSEEKAVQLASKVVSEGFLYGVSNLRVGWKEHSRSVWVQ